jgi:hypothetical protein
MLIVPLTVFIALLGPAVLATQNTPAAQPPAPPAELVALRRIPTLEVRVTTADGTPPAPRVYVNWRNLAEGLTGGGATNPTGQFTMLPQLQWSASSGWRFGGVGPHRVEVVAEGFKTWVADSIDLQVGRTHRLDVVLEPRGAAVRLEADAYTRLATEQVVKSMTAAGRAKGEVRVVGAPVRLPDHALAAGVDSRNLPDAFVLAATYVDGQFREPALVTFRDGRPDVRFSYSGSSGFLPLGEQEWMEMASAVDNLYAVAADVSRGPERFEAFLPQDMRRMLDLRAEKNRLFLTQEAVRTLSNDQLRRFVTLIFDAWALSAWLALEKLPAPLTTWNVANIRRDPVKVIASLESEVQEARRMLNAAGALSAERIAGSQMYVRRLLGEGTMVREDPDRDGISNLPRGARMYTVLLGAPLPHVVLDRGMLRIVAVDLF